MSQEALAGAETPARVPLGQLLIQGGFLTQVQLDDALYEGSRTGERLGEVVVRRGLATEDDVARLLAEQWDLDYVERSSIWFDANALARLSREDAQRLEALPTRVEDGRVVVAVAEPTEQRLGALRELLGEETVMIVVPKSALDAGLRSDLLRSRGQGQFGPSEELDLLEPETTSDVDPDAESDEEWHGDGGGGDGGDDGGDGGDDDEPEALAEVTQLPVQRSDDEDGDDAGDADSDAVALLADEAKAVAERLAAQAAAVKAQKNELKVRSDQYEARIKELEDRYNDLEGRHGELEERCGGLERELEERGEHLSRVRGQLTDLLASFDD